MTKDIAAKAKIPNPALKVVEPLIGEWQTTGKHPYFPDTTLKGRAVFEWVEGGAFLKYTAEILGDDRFPAGVTIIGSDDQLGKMTMLYFDSRGVSRLYQFSTSGNTFKWWRDDPDFSQRFTVTISKDGSTMAGQGEMCRDGKTWEDDLNLTYVRAS